jgi:hypothetical protein
MDKYKILNQWIEHVRKNKERLTGSCNILDDKQGMLATRNYIAELGKELTPDELKDFHLLLKETLSLIEHQDNG